MRRVFAMAGLFGALWLQGCAHRVPPVGQQVRSLRFEDNGPPLSSRSDAALRNAIAHPTPRGIWPFRRKVPLDTDVLEDDRERIAVHYAHQGWFDARLAGWEVVTVREGNDRRPPVVKVIGRIESGERYTVESTELSGAEELPGPLQGALERVIPSTGAGFTLSGHEATKTDLQRLLQEHAHAHATVQGQVEVDRKTRTIDLSYSVDPGPTTTWGEVRLEGEIPAPDALVREAVVIDEGEATDPSDLEQTRQKLYQLGIFSLVTVEPAREGEVVPVEITLQPNEPRAIAAGFGLSAQSGRQEGLGFVRFQHANALQRLISFESRLQAGYAVLDRSLWRRDDGVVRHGPVGEATVDLGLPGVGPRGWQVHTQLSYERALTETAITDQPEATLSWSGPILDRLSLSLAYRLRYTRYADLQVPLDELGVIARDLREGRYFLTELEQKLVYDDRDNPMVPRRGYRHELTLREAGRWLGGEYDYVGGSVDLRAYRPIRLVHDLVLAGRVSGGALVPYGPEAYRSVPLAEHFFLGGASDVRGWVYQHLGPYACADGACSGTDGMAGDKESIVPLGGNVMALTSLELRKYGDVLGGVLFSDWGMVWEDLGSVGSVRVPTPTVGAGLRLMTPAGPFRLDVACRTDRLERFASEPPVWLHVGIGEAF